MFCNFNKTAQQKLLNLQGLCCRL